MTKHLDTDEYDVSILSNVDRLVDWANPPTVKDLKQDYQEARNAHTAQIARVDKWLDNLNVTGSAKLEKVKGRSSIVPKLIRKQAEWRYASLSEPFMSSPDLFNINPVSYEDRESAIQNALVLNNQFNTKLQKVKLIDSYIRSAVDEGTVIARVGWEFEEEEQEVEVDVFENIPVDDPILAQQMIDAGMEPVEQIKIGVHLEKQLVTIKNQPIVEVCDIRNVIIDPTCRGDLNKAQFIIYFFETSLSDLEKDGRYKNLEYINITNSSVLSEPDYSSSDPSSFTFKDTPRKKFVAYEYWGYWDIDKSGIVKPIVATYVNDVMIRLEENPFPDKKPPFISASYLPIRNSIYGEPDGELLEDNQKIIGAVTRGMIDIMGRSANGQQGTRKDALDVTNKRRFDKGLDYEFNPNVDPRQAFYMHTYPEIPNSAHQMLALQNAEAESLTGVKAFSTGISGQALGNTATGIRSALDATSKRELGILRRLAEGIKEIGRKILAMNAVFLSEEEVVRVTNEEFVAIKRDDLAGNFDLDLSISTAEADNEKAQELAFMLQTTAQSMGPQFAQIILADIARLRKMPDLAKKIETYQPTADPLAQQKAMLELELLKAQIANEVAKGNENQVDVQLKQAKTQTELAKSRNLDSKSDQADLDFVEQESATKHLRELDKINTQGKTKLDQTGADSLLNTNQGVNLP